MVRKRTQNIISRTCQKYFPYQTSSLQEHPTKRTIREVIEIEMQSNDLNTRDDSQYLPTRWNHYFTTRHSHIKSKQEYLRKQ